MTGTRKNKSVMTNTAATATATTAGTVASRPRRRRRPPSSTITSTSCLADSNNNSNHESNCSVDMSNDSNIDSVSYTDDNLSNSKHELHKLKVDKENYSPHIPSTTSSPSDPACVDDNIHPNANMNGYSKGTGTGTGEEMKRRQFHPSAKRNSKTKEDGALFNEGFNEGFTTTLHQSNQEISPSPIQSHVLSEAIAQASYSFPSMSSTYVILLEESSPEIINIARRCIRSAADSGKTYADGNGDDNGNRKDNGKGSTIIDINSSKINTNTNRKQSLHMLQVSIHCLRALSSIINLKELERMGMVIKLLYHAITTVESMQKDFCREYLDAHLSSKTVLQQFIDSSLVCFQGYQVLGLLLSRIMDGRVNRSGNGKAGYYLFAVPDLGQGGMDGLEGFGDLSLMQIIKIVTQSHFSVSNVMNRISKVLVKCSNIVGGGGECGGGTELDLDLDDFHEVHRLNCAMQSLFGDTKKYSYNPNQSDDNVDALSSCLGYYKNLISQFAMPWILLPIAMDGSKVSSEKMHAALAMVSKLSKGLLEMASFLEKTCVNCKNQSTIAVLQQHSLWLQQECIMCSLFVWKNEQGCWLELDSAVQSGTNYTCTISKTLGKVCTSAVRASITYSMTKNVDKTVLTKFHCEVGNIIDQTTYSHKLLDPQYVEYSVCRSMHFATEKNNIGLWRKKDECKSCKCILTPIPFPFRHRSKSCEESNAEFVIMAVFHLGLSAKHLIQTESITQSVLDSVIDAFRNRVLKYDCTKGLMLAYQTLSKLKLQTLAVEQMKSTDKLLTAESWNAVYVTGRILGECSGPLNLKMMELVKKDREKYYSLALDCHLRAANLLDEFICQTNYGSTREENCQHDCLHESDRLIERCRELSIGIPGKICLPIVESAAKSLSNIAKRRMTKKLSKESLLPFFASLEIFMAIRDKDLPSRFLQVSSVLQSEGMIKEAFVVLSFSISHLAKQSCGSGFVGIPTLDNVLLFCDDYINGSLLSETFVETDVLPEVMIQSLSRLSRLFMLIVQGGGKRNPLDNSCQSPLAVKIRYFAKQSTLDILGWFVQATIATEDCSTCSLDEIEFRMSMALDFLQCFGGNFAEDARQEGSALEVHFLVECVKTFIYNVKLSFQDSEVVDGGAIASLAIVGVATIRSITKNSDAMDEDKYNLEFVELAANELKDTLQLKSSYKRSAQIMIAQISVMLLADYDDKDMIGLCKAALDMTTRSDDPWIQTGLKNYKNALLLNLFKVLQILERTGLSVVAVEYIPILEKAAEISVRGNLRLGTIITSLFARGELYNLAKGEEAAITSALKQSTHYHFDKVESLFGRVHEEVLSDFSIENDRSGEITNLVIELHTSSAMIQSLMLTEDKGLLRSFVSSLSNTLTVWRRLYLESKVSEDLPKSLILPVAWWSSSCFMALFYGNMRLGDISSAWCSIRLCCTITQTALATLKTAGKETLPVASVDSEDFLASYLCSKGYDIFFKSRRCQCLELIAKVSLSAGDSRRAKRYIIAAAESLEMIPSRTSLLPKSALFELTTLMKCQTIVSLGVRTTMNEIFSTSMSLSAFDHEVLDVVRALSNSDKLFASPFIPNAFVFERAGLDWNREALKYVISIWKKSKILKDYEQVLGVNFLDNVVNQIEILSKFSDPEMTHISSPSFDTSQALKRIHCSLVKNHDSSFSKSICDAVLNLVKKVLIGNDAYLYKKCVFSLLNLVAEESFASSECRAEALYLLATECLEQGRQSGELITLWSQNSKRGPHVVESDDHIPHLMRAKQYLLQAVSFIGPASSLLSRSVLRTLALVLGPEELNVECGISTGELVHSSIGSSARQVVARGLDVDNPLDNRFRPVFEALDHPFSKQNERNEMIEIMHELGHQCIPHRWKFVAITLCPTGEVLVSIAQPSHDVNDNQFFSYQTQCVLPHRFNEFEETVLRPFDDIMDQSRNQISGIDSDVANDKYNNCKEKKQAWWNQRYNLDEKLCQLLEHFDERYFQSSGLEDLMSVDGLDEDDTCIGNLSARFDAVCNIDKKESGTREDTVPSKEELNKLTVVKLKERLVDLGCSPNDFRSLRKAALIDFLHRESLEGCRSKPKSQEKISPNENCIFLILDEQIQRLPLEAVATLHDRTVCRLPSLPFAISSILRKQSNEDSLLSPIDLSKTKYVIDPESNLKETQERILSTLTSVSENNNWDWEGRVGEAPAKDFMYRALQEKCGIFLYFGHGGGERFFSRTDIEELTSDSTCVDPFSSVILMGCSSGMLMSPNCQKGNSGDKMHFEPDGIALSYLCAGAPCVVGNLWDVTDRDIDRYSVSLLKGIYQARGPTNLAKCAMSSRGACKLKYIVGSAPVIYGIPVLIGPLK